MRLRPFAQLSRRHNRGVALGQGGAYVLLAGWTFVAILSARSARRGPLSLAPWRGAMLTGLALALGLISMAASIGIIIFFFAFYRPKAQQVMQDYGLMEHRLPVHAADGDGRHSSRRRAAWPRSRRCFLPAVAIALGRLTWSTPGRPASTRSGPPGRSTQRSFRSCCRRRWSWPGRTIARRLRAAARGATTWARSRSPPCSAHAAWSGLPAAMKDPAAPVLRDSSCPPSRRAQTTVRPRTTWVDTGRNPFHLPDASGLASPGHPLALRGGTQRLRWPAPCCRPPLCGAPRADAVPAWTCAALVPLAWCVVSPAVACWGPAGAPWVSPGGGDAARCPAAALRAT